MASPIILFHKGVEYKVVRQLRSCCQKTQMVVEDMKTGKRKVIAIPRVKT